MSRQALRSLIRDPIGVGDLRSQIMGFLLTYGHADTAGHCSRVAAEAKRVAERYGLDGDAAESAGLLHDISAVIPNEHRVQLAEEIGLTVLDAERAYPMIVHQRHSEAMAETIFGVMNPAVLPAKRVAE